MVGVVGGEVDVVQHHHDGAAELAGGVAQASHHLHAVAHVEVVQGLVQQHVLGVLGEDHRDIGTLALPAGELVEIAVLEMLEVQEVDRLGDLLLVQRRQAPLGVGEAAEAHELADREPGDEVVLLSQHREDLRKVLRGGGGDVVAGHLDRALVDPVQPPHHGQQGGLPRTVGAHQGGDAAGGDLEVQRADVDRVGAGPVLLAHRVEGDHRRPFRMMTARNTLPPTSSMMMETTPCA